MAAPHCNGDSGNGNAEKRLFVRVDHALLPVLACITQYSEKARTSKLKGSTAIAVYVALRSFSDSDLACWPEQPEIAFRAGVSERTVNATLAALAEMGLITISKRNSAGGRQSNLYRFKDSPTAVVATGVAAQPQLLHSPTAVVAAPNRSSCGTRRTIEEEPLKKNQEREATKPSAPPELLALVDLLNSLPSGMIPRIKVPLSPKIVTRYRTAQKDPDLRDALSDHVRLVEAIQRAGFAHGQPWASFLGLLATNKAGEYKILKLLAGDYDGNGSKGNGFQRGSGSVGAGQKYDPNTAGKKATI